MELHLHLVDSESLCEKENMELDGSQIQGQIQGQKRWKLWILFLALTLLLHLLVFLIHVQWNPESVSHTPIEIQQINPAKLDAIRKQWKSKGILLDQNPNQPSTKEVPADAQLLSDRNIHVDKQQRAAVTTVTPKPGSPQASNSPSQSKPQTQAAPRSARPTMKMSTEHFPKLGNLGVPLHLDSYTPRNSSFAENYPMSAMNSVPPGGSQYMDDKNLPVGSENLLNAQESVYYSFYARLYEAIGPIWQSLLRQTMPQNRIASGEYTTAVDVVFDDLGNLLDVHVIQSSGIQEFDTIVGQAWRKIQRFPNPPRGLLDIENHVHTGWSFKVQLGEGINFLPPARTY